MKATLYGVLGVSPDADEQTIVRAFRERAKERHPDVSDDPDATAQFKRLQTARDVLTDSTERARYDRLGHANYLHDTGDCAGWEPPGNAHARSASDRDGSPSATTPESQRRSTTATDGGTSARARASRHVDSGSTDAARGSTHQSRQGSSVPGDGTATAYYQPGQRANPVSDSMADTLVELVRSVGVWALVHVALVLSAVTTAWLILTWGGFSPVSLFLTAFVLVAALAVSTLHLSVRVYP